MSRRWEMVSRKSKKVLATSGGNGRDQPASVCCCEVLMYCWRTWFGELGHADRREIWRGGLEIDRSSLNSLECRIHVEVHTLGGHCGCAGACSRGNGIFVTYERLRMEFERFAHKLGDAGVVVSIKVSCISSENVAYPQTTTPSSMLPHNRATVELNFELYSFTDSSSNRFRTLLYMASSSVVACSSSCSSR